MRVRTTGPEQLDELIGFLETETDATIQRVSDDEAEVCLLGSYNRDAMRMELYLRLRAWEAGRRARDAHVDIVG
jgi:hypothetical protein